MIPIKDHVAPLLILDAPLLLPHTEAPARLTARAEVAMVEMQLKRPPSERLVLVPISEERDGRRLATLALLADIIERPVAQRAFDASFDVGMVEAPPSSERGTPWDDTVLSGYTREYIVVLEGVCVCEILGMEPFQSAWQRARFRALPQVEPALLTEQERLALIGATLSVFIQQHQEDVELPATFRALLDDALVYRIGGAVLTEDAHRFQLITELNFKARYSLVFDHVMRLLVGDELVSSAPLVCA